MDISEKEKFTSGARMEPLKASASQHIGRQVITHTNSFINFVEKNNYVNN